MPPEQNAPQNEGGSRTGGMPSWLIPLLLAVVALVMISALYSQDRAASEESYSDFVTQVEDGNVEAVTWNTADGTITGELADGQEFRTVGPLEAPEEIRSSLAENGVEVVFDYPTPNALIGYLSGQLSLNEPVVSQEGEIGPPSATADGGQTSQAKSPLAERLKELDAELQTLFDGE